ncbi:hypothetical protein AB837_00226 [bacterium AB1]|nr:hypothetical protein AB837_00226 [bacterium AB1]
MLLSPGDYKQKMLKISEYSSTHIKASEENIAFIRKLSSRLDELREFCVDIIEGEERNTKFGVSTIEEIKVYLFFLWLNEELILIPSNRVCVSKGHSIEVGEKTELNKNRFNQILSNNKKMPQSFYNFTFPKIIVDSSNLEYDSHSISSEDNEYEEELFHNPESQKYQELQHENDMLKKQLEEKNKINKSLCQENSFLKQASQCVKTHQEKHINYNFLYAIVSVILLIIIFVFFYIYYIYNLNNKNKDNKFTKKRKVK